MAMSDPTVDSSDAWRRTVSPQIDGLNDYPDFVPLGREHKSLLDTALAVVQPEICELTFAYQWAWRRHTHCRLSRFGDAVLLAMDSASTGEVWLLPPLVVETERAAAVIHAVLTDARQSTAASFARVPDCLAEVVRRYDDLTVADERDRADYVYLGDDLRELPGRRYHDKRTHIRRFFAACPQARYQAMDTSLADRCAAFCREWLAGHSNRQLRGLRREVDTTLMLLADREWLGLSGGVLTADDQIAAFALGEPINETTFAIRAEKADTTHPGAYQAINQAFARHAAGAYQWINREQDLGVAGLRRAKQSYRPHHLVHKYRIRRA